MHISHFVTQNIIKIYSQGMSLRTLIMFSASSKIFLSETLPPCRCHTIAERKNTLATLTTVHFGGLIHSKAPAVLPTTSFAPLVQTSTHFKKRQNILVL